MRSCTVPLNPFTLSILAITLWLILPLRLILSAVLAIPLSAVRFSTSRSFPNRLIIPWRRGILGASLSMISSFVVLGYRPDDAAQFFCIRS